MAKAHLYLSGQLPTFFVDVTKIKFSYTSVGFPFSITTIFSFGETINNQE